MTVCDVNFGNASVTPDPIPCNDRTATVKFNYTVPNCYRPLTVEDDEPKTLCECPSKIVFTGTLTNNFNFNFTSPLPTGLVISGKTFTWTIQNPSGGTFPLSLAIKYVGPVTGGTSLSIFEDMNRITANVYDKSGKITQKDSKITVPSVNVAECEEECIPPVEDDSLIETDITEDCDDAAEIDFIKKPYKMSLGRTVVVRNIKVKNVCPDKALAVGVILYETFEDDRDPVFRGSKHFLIPAHDGETCSDVCLDCLYFVVPEKYPTLCTTRYFSARVIAHHAESDLDFTECQEEPEV